MSRWTGLRGAAVRLGRPRPRVGSPLVGIWRLARVQLRSASGRSSPALFPAATGTLTYRPDGRMTVRISDGQSERPDLAFDGTYLSFLDPFAPTADYVVHRIESGADADGAVRERTQRIALRGDRLIWLGEPTSHAGDGWTAELLWDRVTSL